MQSKLIPTLICVALILVMLYLMWRGWRSRQKRQHEVGSLAQVPSRFEDATALAAYPGTYVSTTKMGDWLERIAVESLGVKSLATLMVFEDGVIIARQGAQDLWIPVADIVAVRTESGMSGKFVEKNGLVIITWSLNGIGVDTGFRTQYAEHKQPAVSAVQGLSANISSHLPL